MIILRQREFADKDYAGVKTNFGRSIISGSRKLKAGIIRRGRRANQRSLEKELNKAGMGIERFEVEGQGGNKLIGSRIINTGTKHNDRNAGIIATNYLGKYNNRNEIGSNRLSRVMGSITTTKDKPTNIYNSIFNPQPEFTNTSGSGKKSGLGKKIAIGAGAAGLAAAAYGGYRYLQNKKQQEEEQQNNNIQR